MKLSLILAFAFSLGVGLTLSAEKIPQREERDAPTLDDDHSVSYRSASRGGKHASGMRLLFPINIVDRRGGSMILVKYSLLC